MPVLCQCSLVASTLAYTAAHRTARGSGVLPRADAECHAGGASDYSRQRGGNAVLACGPPAEAPQRPGRVPCIRRETALVAVRAHCERPPEASTWSATRVLLQPKDAAHALRAGFPPPPSAGGRGRAAPLLARHGGMRGQHTG